MENRINYLKGILLDFRREYSEFDASTNKTRVRDVLDELAQCQMTVGLIRKTGIGKALNSFRKTKKLPMDLRQNTYTLLCCYRKMAKENLPVAIVNPQSIVKRCLPNASKSKPNKKSSWTDINGKWSAFNRIGTSSANVFQQTIKSERARASDFSLRKTNVKIPSLQDLCIRRLKQNSSKIGNARGARFDSKIMCEIFGSSSGEELWRVCNINPQWRDDIEPLWQSICKKELPDKFLTKTFQKTQSWFKTWVQWQTEEKQREANCLKLAKAHEETKRKSSYIATKRQAAILLNHSKKRRRKIAPAKPTLIRRGFVAQTGVPSQREWSERMKSRRNVTAYKPKQIKPRTFQKSQTKLLPAAYSSRLQRKRKLRT